jgi:predicted GNAT family acetyltransferase
LLRCQQRIERHRVWALIRSGEVIFKADIISETPDVIYLEGIYVNPNYRNKGLGSRCLKQLGRGLLNRAQFIVVLVNENRTNAHRFFQRVGFVASSVYDTLFLAPSDGGDDSESHPAR